jgi:hypothetical protein
MEVAQMRVAKRPAMLKRPTILKRHTLLVIAAGALIAMSGTAALGNESNCRQLEDLARQYAGVKLSSQQQQMKRRLLAWYNDNCKRPRTRQARR